MSEYGVAGLVMSPVEERFWSKVQRGDGCWIWLASKQPRGYGTFRLNRRSELAHRVAWQLTNGPIPYGMLLCHRCDTCDCVRPDHLFLGTHLDNNLDALAKGRNRAGGHPPPHPSGDAHWTRRYPERVLRGDRHPRKKHPELFATGERHPSAKITAAEAAALRASYAAGGVTQTALAAEYGLSQGIVSKIILRKLWKA